MHLHRCPWNLTAVRFIDSLFVNTATHSQLLVANMDEQRNRAHSADAVAASTRTDRKLDELLALLRSRPNAIGNAPACGSGIGGSQSTILSAAAPSVSASATMDWPQRARAAVLLSAAASTDSISWPQPEKSDGPTAITSPAMRSRRRRSSGVADLLDMEQLKGAHFSTSSEIQPSAADSGETSQPQPAAQEPASVTPVSTDLPLRARKEMLLGAFASACPTQPSAENRAALSSASAAVRARRRRSSGVSDLLEMDRLKNAHLSVANSAATAARDIAKDEPRLLHFPHPPPPPQVMAIPNSNSDSDEEQLQAKESCAIHSRQSHDKLDLPEASFSRKPAFQSAAIDTSNTAQCGDESDDTAARELLSLATRSADREAENDAENAAESSGQSSKSSNVQIWQVCPLLAPSAFP